MVFVSSQSQDTFKSYTDSTFVMIVRSVERVKSVRSGKSVSCVKNDIYRLNALFNQSFVMFLLPQSPETVKSDTDSKFVMNVRSVECAKSVTSVSSVKSVISRANVLFNLILCDLLITTITKNFKV